MSKKEDMKSHKNILCEDDGLILPEVGTWAEEKYQKIGDYCAIFSTGMKNKWDFLVYLDLYAGAGKCKIGETGKVLLGSPFLALSVKDSYSKYIFCESDSEKMEALQKRIKKYFPEKECAFIPIDCNISIEEILAQIPPPSKSKKVLTFCLVDPCNVSQLEFKTIQTISRIFVDFLILIPTYMDINRNIKIYLREDINTLDKFIGNNEWRGEWKIKKYNPRRFPPFILDKFCQQMKKIGYLFTTPEDFILIKNEEDRNQPLYHLVFFTRSLRGLDFWRKTKNNKEEQNKIIFE